MRTWMHTTFEVRGRDRHRPGASTGTSCGLFSSYPIYLSILGIHTLCSVSVSILRRPVDLSNRGPGQKSSGPGKRRRAVIEVELLAKGVHISYLDEEPLGSSPLTKVPKVRHGRCPCSAGTLTSSLFLPRIMVVDSSRAAWHKHRWWSRRRGI